MHQELPETVFNSKAVKIGLTIETGRLTDIRKTRINILNDKKSSTYTDQPTIDNEIKGQNVSITTNSNNRCYA